MATIVNKSPNTLLSREDFTSHPRLLECIRKLETEFGPPPGQSDSAQQGPSPKRSFVVSDVLDGEGNQYVNLVQKGGGVLGIALVGYTYILEHMGVRFLRLAGTSAGAINTALMTVIGKKEDKKSLEILKSVSSLDFFNLVDGHPTARWIIKKFITNGDFSAKVRNWVVGVLFSLGALMAADFIFLGLQTKHPDVRFFTGLSFVLTGFFLLIIGILIYYAITLIRRLKNSGIGINPGDFFFNWIDQQMKANGVKTTDDLNRKASAPVPGLHLRMPHERGHEDLVGDVTFIASELVTQNKVLFPQMSYLFRRDKDMDSLPPAGFVRASMAIPVFFESYFITEIPCKDETIRELWMKTFNEKDPPETARFVDGGILSNFPIDIFYNPKIDRPRLPVFGIDLDDSSPEDTTKHAFSWSFNGYFTRLFNTVRFYYDKDFLLKNKMFEMGIGTIKLSEYNWLNFFLSKKQKLDMLLKGAEAATEFLMRFDWESYKVTRSEGQKKMGKK